MPGHIGSEPTQIAWRFHFQRSLWSCWPCFRRFIPDLSDLDLLPLKLRANITHDRSFTLKCTELTTQHDTKTQTQNLTEFDRIYYCAAVVLFSEPFSPMPLLTITMLYAAAAVLFSTAPIKKQIRKRITRPLISCLFFFFPFHLLI